MDERTEIERDDYVCNSKSERNTPQADTEAGWVVMETF